MKTARRYRYRRTLDVYLRHYVIRLVFFFVAQSAAAQRHIYWIIAPHIFHRVITAAKIMAETRCAFWIYS